MVFIKKDKLFSGEWFKNYALILTGSFILAAGFVYFITPYKIVPGGVYGISIVIHYMTKGVFSFAPEGFPIGLMGLILNIPLTIIGIKILGPRFGMKTIVGFFLTSGFIDLLSYSWGDQPLVEDDALLSSVFGGVLIGFGLALIFMSRASSGGSDIVAMIIEKYTRKPLGVLLIYVDSVIVLIGLIAFRDWKIPLYSWIVIYITGRVIDGTMQGLSYSKSLMIISDKYELIRQKLLFELERGGTYIPAQGMWEGEQRKIIFTNISRREFVILRDYIMEIDPNAFVTVFDASEVLGLGFKPIKET
ncbi:MAG: YitT family protein [Bacteroidales bacterium]